MYNTRACVYITERARESSAVGDAVVPDNLYANLYALNNDVRRCLPTRLSAAAAATAGVGAPAPV